ncbi:MAG: multiheme c-type cytochrome, partial [Ginsengibacter sp.]
KETQTKQFEKREVNFQQFSGSASCRKCHQDIYEKHLLTGHHLTSIPAAEKYIKGSFEKGENIFSFHPGLYVSMERRDSGLYQAAFSQGVEKVARRFDIIMGSGTKGQTFLAWQGNNLFQLPITYFTQADAWCNSPGFPDKVIFNRPATVRCLECHATYANKISSIDEEPDAFDHKQIIYGVECEKCHGEGDKHVLYETEHPGETPGKYIINPGKLSRQQSLDLCALCHGGRLSKTQPSFEFTVGKNLADYFVKDTSGGPANIIDVHGNQYGLLQQSKCFKNTSSLTCVTCHNTHENERGKLALFSARCMTCHKPEDHNFCKNTKVSKKLLKSNCIDCHMPKEPSMSVAVILEGKQLPTPALLRTHFIKVYSEIKKAALPATSIN